MCWEEERGAVDCGSVHGCKPCDVLLQLAALALGNLQCTVEQIESKSVCMPMSVVETVHSIFLHF